MADIDVGIVWFRQDLRLADQPALAAAASQHHRLVPLYIWAPEEDGEWAPGAASRWWLHDSLVSLDASLRRAGSGLVLRQSSSLVALTEIIKKTGATAVYWNALCEPAAARRDAELRMILEQRGVRVHVCNGSLLREPHSLSTKAGTPYLVYGAFWRSLVAEPVPDPGPTPRQLPPLPSQLGTVSLARLARYGFKPKIPWDQGFAERWVVGEAAGHRGLAAFRSEGVGQYAARRDVPGVSGTSRLSPYLHFGELSARQVWAASRACTGPGVATYTKQLVWREFSYHLLHHYPRLTNEPLRLEFKDFPWKTRASQLRAWQRGMTGYPIVDAGMRELWHTGWMHNRVRMIVASFLVKDLGIHWLKGATWFWDTLLDADLANNTLGWQWVSGCGADAAPYFRVFHPVLQGRKFDPAGTYVRRWVPELAQLTDRMIHTPWESGERLAYPGPIVDHSVARKAALEAFHSLKRLKRQP